MFCTTTFRFQIHIAAAGNVVLNERVDVFKHKSGAAITLPVMGTITVDEEMITVWRDYFDPAEFDRQLGKIKRAAEGPAAIG